MESIAMKIAKDAANAFNLDEPQTLEEAKKINGGSEISSIKGIVSVLRLSPEMEEKMIQDVYNSDTISPEVAKEIQRKIVEITGTTSPNIVRILSIVHDEWVKNNANNFMKISDGKKRNKEYQFVPLELLNWNEVKSDLLFLKPILEASGIEVKDEEVKNQFEVAQKEFLIEHKLFSAESLKDNLQNGSKFYPAVEGLETKFGGNIDILLKDPPILEAMVSQVERQVSIKQRDALEQEIIESDNPCYDDVVWFSSSTIEEADRPISIREILLSKLAGTHLPGKYKGPYGHEREIDLYNDMLARKRNKKNSKETELPEPQKSIKEAFLKGDQEIVVLNYKTKFIEYNKWDTGELEKTTMTKAMYDMGINMRNRFYISKGICGSV